MNLFTYDEDGQKSVLAVENVTPVKYCNDGNYHICDECNAEYYVNDNDTILYNADAKAVWNVEDIGEEEPIYQVKGAVLL